MDSPPGVLKVAKPPPAVPPEERAVGLRAARPKPELTTLPEGRSPVAPGARERGFASTVFPEAVEAAEAETAPTEAPSPKSEEKPAAPAGSGPAPALVPEDLPPPVPIPVERLTRKLAKSAKLFAEGKKLIPNSSSSLIRVASYDPCPPFITRGKGALIWDEDGNEYLDFNLAYGCLINGHAPAELVKAISEVAESGLHFASPTELEIQLAKQFRKLVPSAERVAFGSNGSDATMNAIRIARAATGKDGLLKFEGHYHGQHDYALISAEAPPIVAGLDEYPRPLPNSAGIPPGVTDYVMVAPFNSIPSLERMIRRNRDRLAAVILEPVMANAGVIPPAADYLKQVRELTQQNDILLIFDEVFTGFRVAPGGAQQLYKVEPDLSCWAKALGGGITISAVSGKAEYMDLIAPGRISYGGTYFANNLSLAASLANLKMLSKGGEDFYARLGKLTEKMEKGLEQAARDTKIPLIAQSVTGMLQFFFTRRKKITNYREALQIDWNVYLRHQELLLDRGIYIHPDGYERLTFSSAHTEKDVERFLSIANETLAELKTLPRDSFN